jgi:hypothetical protein
MSSIIFLTFYILDRKNKNWLKLFTASFFLFSISFLVFKQVFLTEYLTGMALVKNIEMPDGRIGLQIIYHSWSIPNLDSIKLQCLPFNNIGITASNAVCRLEVV